MPSRWWSVLGVLTLICMPVRAADPATPQTPPAPAAPRPPAAAPPAAAPAVPQPAPPAPAPDTNMGAPQTDAYSEAPPSGGEAAASANPNMFGDYLGVYCVQNSHLVPVVGQGPFKIADNDSPFPHDSFGILYQYYSNIAGDTPPFSRSFSHREVLYAEQSFFCGYTSFEVRVPFIQVDAGHEGDSYVGDLNFIVKQALFRDGESDVLTVGLSVVAPTGNSIFATNNTGAQEKFHPTLIQPFLGFFKDLPDVGYYLQGFVSVEFSDDPRFPSLAFADVGLGKWLYYNKCWDRFLTGVAATVEFHSDSAISDAGLRRVNDLTADTAAPLEEIAITAGVDFIFLRHGSIGFGVSVPLTGPSPYDYELITRMNFKF